MVLAKSFAGAAIPAVTVPPPMTSPPAFIAFDDVGRSLTFVNRPTRIVSLSPGATEMLFAAGAGQHVIATVEYSDEPEAARRVPRIGDALAVDMERLAALRPDVVVAWAGGTNAAQLYKISQMNIPIYRQEASTLDALAGSLRRLGELAGTSEIADPEAANIESRLATLAKTYANTPRRSVMVQVWNHPIYTIGGTQLISDAVKLCGGRNVFGDLTDLSPAVDVEAVVARNPDIIIAAAPVGSSAEWLADWKRFTMLHAVRRGNLIPFEDQRLTRLGPSFLGATEGLCKALASAH